MDRTGNVPTCLQPTMWLGTEDGCLHIYNCSDTIRQKKNRIKIQLGAAILCVVCVANQVFVSLANGDVIVYRRDNGMMLYSRMQSEDCVDVFERCTGGPWCINEPKILSIGSIMSPVNKLLPVHDTVWCATQNVVKVLNVFSLVVEVAISFYSKPSFS